MDSNRPGRRALLKTARRCALVALVLGSGFLQAGCVEPAKPKPPAPTTVVGRVVQLEDAQRGVPGVMARAVGKSNTTTTDSTGWFSLTLDVADGEIVQLSLSKVGFDEFVTSFAIRSGTTNRLPTTVTLYPLGTSPGNNSGPASSIVLKSTSATSIGVRHSGANESALLVFEVRDALGRPVGSGNRARIQFTLGQLPGGGAFLSPDTATTDTFGLVAVSLNAGTLAQSVQVRAQVAGSSIYSDLVTVAIHGGLPDAQHFSFATGSVNVPGLLQFGIVNPVTAFVGDRYGNPVPVGTVVYFSTTGGLIQGSAQTDDHGRAFVDLVTSEPLPNSTPAFSDSAGIARISVQTVGEGGAPITRSGLAVLFSGHSEVTISPPSFDIPLNTSQDFVVTVWDKEHHNPLTKGSTIAFSATAGAIGGQATVVLPDTRDKQYTSFTFRLENYSGAAPMLLGPNRSKIRLTPIKPASQVDGVTASTALATPGRFAEPAATVRGSITVTVTSSNGNISSTVTGTVERP